MARRSSKHTSIKSSLFIAVSLGLLSFSVGYVAYQLLRPNRSISNLEYTSLDNQKLKNKSWPEVKSLSASGLRPVSEDILHKCKKALKLKPETQALADKSNYGLREPIDALGRQIPNQPSLIVLHETVIPASATINLFKTYHANDNDQLSYHMLVNQDGELIRVVPDENRAFGTGYSAFGDFSIHAKSPDNFSINNVTLHISLESPTSGQAEADAHSGYTRAQYDSLAKQVLLWQAKYRIPIFRLTTHANVDRSHSRYDPRSFRWNAFDSYHRQHAITCKLKQFTLPQ